MIRAVHLTKTFGTTVALSNIELHVERGECLGLTGPNGGGRTTLLRILATLLGPSKGTVEIDGIDAVRNAHQVRSRLVYVGGEWPAREGLSVREYLAFVADARRGRGTPTAPRAVDAVMDRAKLPADVLLDALSAGMRQRVALAAALLIAPAVLLLDDPFRSMDAAARALFTEWLSEQRDRGTTLVVAVNDDETQSSLCRHVTHLDGGRVVSRSRMADLDPRGPALRALAVGEA